MDHWLTPKDLAERWKCSTVTARSRMRQMIHLEKPLLVRESTVAAWENARLMGPGLKSARRKSQTGQGGPARYEQGKHLIPRRRA